jgi:hypothetical protein
MDNVMRDSLGWPRQTQPVATQLVKVTRASTGVSFVISTARVDRIEQHTRMGRELASTMDRK